MPPKTAMWLLKGSNEGIQLVILNIRMPRMDGLEALPLIKTYSPTTKSSCIQGIAHPRTMQSQETRRKCVRLEAASNAEILDTVRKVLQGQAT